ncbi:RagB/SusD family nutrient uptake outer membrane protein [Lacibacter luteus]|nr:RagB/SusD family nutrient uptake outer membrane protein [Lacibacter luteus]
MKKYKLILPLVALLSASSCKKLINIQETDLIAGDVALKTVTNVESAVIGAYAGVGVEMGILFNSTLSDEVATAGEFYNAATTHEWQYSPTDVGIRDNFTAINPNYTIIDRANRILAVVNTADSTKVGDNTKRARLKGEALFLRAYCHFELFRYYCGNYNATALAMPYMTTPNLLPQGRIQLAEYFQKINADINEAKPLLPNNLTDKNRATLAAANGLHARIALYTGNWADAETYATAYINALPLATSAQFPGIWSDANTTEVAFQLVRTVSVGGRIGSLFRNTGLVTAPGTNIWKPSSKLWNSYDQTNDVRFATYIKDEPIYSGLGRPSRIVVKYIGGGIGSGTENVNNAKVYRTGEMYLIRAEARAEQNKITGANSAESDINALRAARITGYVNEVFATKQAAIDAIITERFKELPFEGHRFWDLKRKGLAVQRLAADAPTVTGQTLPANDYRFVLPIPQTELNANPNMQQNPGYK